MDLKLDSDLTARLERRMQFVMGPRPLQASPGWRSSVVAGGFHLSSHPDLDVTTVARSGVTLTLLGFVLDPDMPGDSNQDILARLSEDVAGGKNVFSALRTLGGRYLLIVGGDSPLVVGDAAGSLQLFYSVARGSEAVAPPDVQGSRVGPGGRDTEVWCAAQADLLASHLELEVEAQAAEYIAFARDSHQEYAWPVDSSPYAEVRRLLPNHFLDLYAGVVSRYWPLERMPSLGLDEVTRRVARRFAGLVEAGANRFPLAMGISSGLDSRLMLAATRKVLDRVVFYTGQDDARDAGHPDVVIPKAMLADAGATHHVIDSRGFGSPAFTGLLERSVPYAHLHRAPALESQLAHYRLERVAAIGNVSENSRGTYLAKSRPKLPPEGMTAEYCALLTSQVHPFAVRQFGRWVEGARETNGLDPRDLLFWESRTGSWFAQNVSEFVLAWREVYLPYNCRALLEDMLAAPAELRVKPSNEFYSLVIRELWPELLKYPINPVGRIEALRKWVYRTLRRMRRRLRGRTERP